MRFECDLTRCIQLSWTPSEARMSARNQCLPAAAETSCSLAFGAQKMPIQETHQSTCWLAVHARDRGEECCIMLIKDLKSSAKLHKDVYCLTL